MAELGVNPPVKGNHGDFLAGLDDAAKAKAQEILDQQKDGTTTREEAQTQLAKLSVGLPTKGDHGSRGDFLTGLEDATKEKAQVLN